MRHLRFVTTWAIVHVGIPCVLVPYLKLRFFFQPDYRMTLHRERWPWSWFT